ncbi:hypothetical protein FSP39_007302 [Pinctada imbricata]|uniref:Trans-1,2-dihydrobenzene-1,2-diol dehydrogenase n=1 Tax=Pinctada imbricata TaxID=66713 RepID=A0AA88YHW7_PINIB|nr:hypothetical protein FSP39_007302 [Pinctada imbricata]
MKLRWGICGAGRVSSDFCHALLTLPSDEHELTSIASKSEERAKEFADKFNIKHWYGSYEELAKDYDIDIIYIGTWHTSHVALSKLMLNAGKHVLCEKPMCLNIDQVKEVFLLAEEKKKFFAEGIWSRYFPIYDKVREEIKSGSIGDVQLVTATFSFSLDSSKWRLENGDGMLLGLGLYTIQFANWIFNNEKPTSIIAVGSLRNQGVDEDGCVVLTYKRGAKASFSYSLKCKGVNPATIYGSKGCIHIPDFFWCPVETTFPSGTVKSPLTPDDPTAYNYPNSMGFRYEAKQIRQYIMQGSCESVIIYFAIPVFAFVMILNMKIVQVKTLAIFDRSVIISLKKGGGGLKNMDRMY